MMNDVQNVLWDMQGPLYEEINKLSSTLPSPSRQASLDRLNKISELIKDAWKVSEAEDKVSKLQAVVDAGKAVVESEAKARRQQVTHWKNPTIDILEEAIKDAWKASEGEEEE